MKNKKSVYILLPIVIAIWGAVIYQFMSFGSSDANIHPKSSLSLPTIQNAKVDTFSISADYRDPFLGKVAEVKKSDIPKVKAVPMQVKSALPWPTISYGGVIKNQKSSKQLCLLSISGQDNIAQAGDVVEGVELKKVWKDSIEVLFQQEKRIIRK